MQPGPKLVIVCGLPGSGKTTHARALEAEQNAIRFCPDEWMQALQVNLHDEAFRDRLETLQWTVARQLLTHGVSVLIEWGTWGRGERDRLRREARALGASVELHYLSAPEEVLFERITRRAAETPPIGREAVAHWSALFEVPTPDELALFDHVLHLEPDPPATR